MDINEAFGEILQQFGWNGTAEDLVEALKQDFNQDVCTWLYGLGNSNRQKKAQSVEDHTRAIHAQFDTEWAKAKEESSEVAQLDKEKVKRYIDECYLAGYAGEERDDDSSTWLWWLLGLAGLGLGGYYLTRNRT